MAGRAGNQWTLFVGKQASKGTPNVATGPKLRYTGGFGPRPVRNLLTLAESDSNRQEGDQVVVGSRVEGTSEHYVRPSEFHTLADLLLGSTVTTGAAADKTHTSSALASGATAYATLVRALASTVLVDQYNDCQIARATIRGGAEQALTCSLEWLGLAAALGASDPAIAAIDEAPLVYPQVTVTKDGSAAAIVDSFEIVISQSRSLVLGDTGLAAAEIAPGQFAVSGSLSLLFETDADYREFHTGSDVGTVPGTTISTQPLLIEAVESATRSIAFDLNGIQTTEYDPPGNTDGAFIRVGASFRAKRQATLADVLEIITKNQIATP